MEDCEVYFLEYEAFGLDASSWGSAWNRVAVQYLALAHASAR